MNETNSKQPLDNEVIEQYVSPILSDAIKGRAKQSILDAVQYVEQLGAYGRGGHLQDMTIYALFQALKLAVIGVSGATKAIDELLAKIKAKNEQLNAISEIVDSVDPAVLNQNAIELQMIRDILYPQK